MEKVNDSVLKELRKRNIQLWLPPYFYSDNDDGNTQSSGSENSSTNITTKTMNQGSNQVALRKLASDWSAHLGERGESNYDVHNTIPKEVIYQSLLHFQTKALEKLKAKKEQKKTSCLRIGRETTHSKEIGTTFTFKIIGLHLRQSNNHTDDNNNENIEKKESKFLVSSDDVIGLASFTNKWAQNVKAHCESLVSSSTSSSFEKSAANIKEGGPMIVKLTLQNISLMLTVSTFLLDLKKQLNVDSTANDNNSAVIRMIYQGTNLLQSYPLVSSDCLYEVVSSHSHRHSSSPFVSRDERDVAGPTILCLILPQFTTIEPCPPTTSTNSTHSDTHQNQKVDDLQLIDSIKNAASRITKTSKFDITDQNGKIVSMTNKDRLAFLTTLGLHKLGQRKLYDNIAAVTDNINNVAGGKRSEEGSTLTGVCDSMNTAASALTFLLQADAEWNNNSPSAHFSSSSSEEWKTKADNYGLLQLDIAWTYLKLQSMEHLPDAIQRLDVAERVLRKQVHTNFVTLALVQAEMEHGMVPPLAAVFVKLFLLQGVGYMHSAASTSVDNCSINRARQQMLRKKGKERLDWARLLCQHLRNASSPASVLHLQEVVSNLSKYDAISALRKCNGDANAAVEFIEKDRRGVFAENQTRIMQKKIGLCENGMDYVNLDLIHQLGSILALDCGDEMGGKAEERENGSRTMIPGHAKNRRIIQSLLRLSNNDVGKAIDLYQAMQMDGDEVLCRALGLDNSSGDGENYRARQNKRKRSRGEIDEMALATLESMGVEESMARMALQRTKNDVEASLFWLTEQNQNMEENKDVVSTSGSSSSSSSSSASRSSNKEDLESCGSMEAKRIVTKDTANENFKKETTVLHVSGTNIKTKISDEKAADFTVDETILEKSGRKEKEERLRREQEEKERLRQEQEEKERLRQEKEERFRQEREEEDAIQMLQDLLMKQGDDNAGIGYYIGSDLDEEWSLIQKYQSHL